MVYQTCTKKAIKVNQDFPLALTVTFGLKILQNLL